jgi:hypothetical protein
LNKGLGSWGGTEHEHGTHYNQTRVTNPFEFNSFT